MSIKEKLLTVDSYAQVPLKWVGPVKLSGSVEGNLKVPLATYESPLWPSVERGARVTAKAGGIKVIAAQKTMTRSICLQAPDAQVAEDVISSLDQEFDNLAKIVSASSSYAELKDITAESVGNLVYIRVAINPQDASGHNMVTKSAEAIQNYLLEKTPSLSYVSVSGNYCSDKKVSAINGLHGRGQKVTAEVLISETICKRMLRATPEEIEKLVYKKNYVGSALAGSLRSANAHFANILLAFYLATGQDAANIIEGSQGFTFAEVKDGDLYFAVTLPNIIVGTVGNGKELGFVNENLEQLACKKDCKAGLNSERLACLIAAAVLCGELSLLAALTNQGELIDTHLRLER